MMICMDQLEMVFGNKKGFIKLILKSEANATNEMELERFE